MSDRLAGLILGPLADVSIRWGLLILALAAWYAIRPPRRAATRHLLGVAALIAGPALLLAPRWDAYVYGPPPAPAPIPAPAFPAMRPPAPAEARAIEARIEAESRTPAASAGSPAAAPTAGAPIDWPLVAARVAVAAWLVGALLMLARLALGVRALRRWARRASPATADDRAMLDACRVALPTARPVRLMRHPGAASPVMAGGLRPTIMLPPDWDAWPPGRRRAALRHELAHVRRYDDASKFLEELVRVPMWFHPAVAWLLARIDRERELLCDEAAVAAGDDPKGLARLLLDLSRSPSPRRLPSASLPFLTRRTTAVRIRRLLEDDMPRTLSRPSLARTLLLGPAALAALLALGTLRVREATAQDAPAPSPAAYSDVKFSVQFIPTSPPAAPRPIEGIVVDPEKVPIAGATVVVHGGAEIGRRVLTTDEAGRFSTPGPSKPEHVDVIAFKPGFAPTVQYRSLAFGGQAEVAAAPEGLMLQRPAPFAGVLVDEQDRPLAGARVRVIRTATLVRFLPLPGDDPASARRYQTFPRRAVEGSPVERALTATTAEDGSFALPEAAGGDSGLRLEIVAADGRALIVRLPSSTGPGWSLEREGFVDTRPDRPARLVAIPGARVEGRVATRVAGVDVSRLRVELAADRPSLRSPSTSPNLAAVAHVGANGRFLMDGLDGGAAVILVHGEGEGRTWTYRAGRGIELKPGETASPTIELIEGVEVTGVVASADDDRPVAGAKVGVNGPFRPITGGTTFPTATGEDGRYRLRLPPGRTFLFIQEPPEGFDRAWGRSTLDVTIPEGVAAFEAPPLAVSGERLLHGRVVDAQSRPIPDARVVLLNDASIPPAATDEIGKFRIRTPGGGLKPDHRAAVEIRLGDGREFRRVAVADASGSVGDLVAAPAPAPPARSIPAADARPLEGAGELEDGRKFQADAAPDAAGEYVVKFAERVPAAQPAPAAIVPEAPQKAPAGVAPIEGAVVDPDGKSVAGATVVVAGDGDFGRRTLTTDDAGRFSTPGAQGEGSVYVLAVKAGYAPASTTHDLDSTRPEVVQNALVLKLSRPAPFAATLVDEDDRPIAGVTVRVIRTAFRSDLDGDGTRIMIGFLQFPRERTAGTPIDPMLTATTAADGSFTLPEAAPSGYGLRLEITAADGRPRLVPRPKWDRRDWSLEHQGFVVVRPGEAIRLKTLPAARVVGKVVAQVPGVDSSRLRAWIQGSRPGPDAPPESGNLQGESPVDAEGRFLIDGLDAGTVDVFVRGEGEAESWTYRAVKDLELAPGRDSAAEFELIEGVEVSGLVTSKDGGRPIPGALVAVYGPFRPKTGATTIAHATDADGRYRFRLPPGETYLYVFDVPAGYSRDPEDPEGNRTVTIPEGVDLFEVPPLRAKATRATSPEVTEKAGPDR